VSDEDNKKLAILASTWLKSKLPATLQKFDKAYEQNPINAENFAELLAMLYSKEIPATHAQTVLNYMCEHEKESSEYLADPSHIVDKLGLSAMDNTDELRAIVEEVIKNNPDQVAQYKAGKESVAQFFMGQVMRATKGSASPQAVMTIIKEILTSMPA
jgi:aspartyl-tRNA(Asn)/glutamyl-tRNA(Gln) amidotransferase subunit B